jgi:transcriptional regulator with XRE-family HTH domain
MATLPNLFKLMKDKKLTAAGLSRATKISTGSIGDWKSGRSTPGARQLLILADYFKVSCDYILGRTDDMGQINLDTSGLLKKPINAAKKKIIGSLDDMNTRQLDELNRYADYLIQRKDK